MIAVDTSVWISYFQGIKSTEVDCLDEALANSQVVLPCVVLAELLSAVKNQSTIESLLTSLPRLDVSDDFWVRVGQLRRVILSKKLKSRLGDAMIAQLCLDHGVNLLTNDKDFRHYKKHAGLKLVEF